MKKKILGTRKEVKQYELEKVSLKTFARRSRDSVVWQPVTAWHFDLAWKILFETPVCSTEKQWCWWWQFKHCLFSPRKLEKMSPFWRAYFSDGLVQPPTRWCWWWLVLLYVPLNPFLNLVRQTGTSGKLEAMLSKQHGRDQGEGGKWSNQLGGSSHLVRGLPSLKLT